MKFLIEKLEFNAYSLADSTILNSLTITGKNWENPNDLSLPSHQLETILLKIKVKFIEFRKNYFPL